MIEGKLVGIALELHGIFSFSHRVGKIRVVSGGSLVRRLNGEQGKAVARAKTVRIV